MKIRMINNCEVVRTLQETDHWADLQGEFFVERMACDGEYRFYSKADWEEIPEGRWEDVTGNCLLTPTHRTPGDHSFELTRGTETVARCFNGYRLRKVELWDILPMEVRNVLPNDWGAVLSKLSGVYAFLVEKKVSEAVEGVTVSYRPKPTRTDVGHEGSSLLFRWPLCS